MQFSRESQETWFLTDSEKSSKVPEVQTLARGPNVARFSTNYNT